MTKPELCPFCEIIAGRVEPPAGYFRHGNFAASFQPLNPHAPGHKLFVPLQHVRDVTQYPYTGRLFELAQTYAKDMRAANIITSYGAEATQSVFHLHVHVIPRGPSDGLSPGWPWK